MCKLNGIFFGFADSEEEFSEKPELFDSAFVDPHNYLDMLLYKSKYLILGRKGTGKTAFSAKMRRVASLSDDIVVNTCSLSDMNYVTFNTFSEPNVMGGKRFYSIWKYLLMIEVIKTIYKEYPDQQNEELQDLYEKLIEYGFITTDSLVRTVTKLNLKELDLKFGNFASVKSDIEKNSTLNSPDEMAEIIINTIKDCYFFDKKFFLVLDGLDDVLRITDFSADIVTGLVRAVSKINKSFSKENVCVKIILLMRTDIFEMCRDPDLNKIKRDFTIDLSWTKDDLKTIVYKRIQVKHPDIPSFDAFWDAYAPKSIRNKPSASYLFELTLLRPRDILQFFIEAQRMYGANPSLTYSELNTVASGYSKNYFIGEMRDELTGVLHDNVVTIIPEILSDIGSHLFMEKDVEQQCEHKELGCTVRQLLETLYNAGYIGQIRSINGKDYYSFRHINYYTNYNPKDRCVVHRGLRKALNIT